MSDPWLPFAPFAETQSVATNLGRRKKSFEGIWINDDDRTGSFGLTQGRIWS
jgi:hypothetical protein